MISSIDADAFAGLDVLKELLLGENYLKRLKLEAIPPQLERLELQVNLMDLLPDFSYKDGVITAPNLKTLYVFVFVLDCAFGASTNLIATVFGQELEPQCDLGYRNEQRTPTIHQIGAAVCANDLRVHGL